MKSYAILATYGKIDCGEENLLDQIQFNNQVSSNMVSS